MACRISSDFEILPRKLKDRERMLWKRHNKEMKWKDGKAQEKTMEELRKNEKAKELLEKVSTNLLLFKVNPTEDSHKRANISVEVFGRYIKTLDPKLPFFEEEDLEGHIQSCAVCRGLLTEGPKCYKRSSRPVELTNQDTVIEQIQSEAEADPNIPSRFTFIDGE